MNNTFCEPNKERVDKHMNGSPKQIKCCLYKSLPIHKTISSLDLDLTEACNLACVYCFKWQKKAVHMDEVTAKTAIDWLLEASGNNRDLKINFMGGEPLLRFDLIKKIVPYGKIKARQLGKSLHFGCTTNCTVLTEDMLVLWRKYGMGFHCSIDGIPEVQNVNRPLLGGGASSHLIEKNVPKILAYRPEVMARATVSPTSVYHLFDSVKYLSGLGFRSITFKVAVNCNWLESDFEALQSQYAKVSEYYLRNIIANKPLNIDEFRKGLHAMHSVNQNSRFPCGAGRGLILIDPRGEIWPCHRFGPHQCGGQFRLGKLGEQFNDRLRVVFLNYDIARDAKANCKQCRAKLTCRTWCYAECVDSTHSFYDPGSEYCRANQILHDQILHLHDELRSKYSHVLQKLLQQDRSNGNASLNK